MSRPLAFVHHSNDHHSNDHHDSKGATIPMTTIARTRNPKAKELGTDRLTLFAALRVAEHFDLPNVEDVRLAVATRDAIVIGELINQWLRLAGAEAQAVQQESDVTEVVVVGRAVMDVTVLARPILDAVQGTRPQAPAGAPWALLLSGLAVGYVVLKDRNELQGLAELIASVAEEISTL